ncbi:MAG: hypothetical protein AAGP08_05655 [Pseudomonadota bacterium]
MSDDTYDLILGYRSNVTEDDVAFFAENPSRLDMLDARDTRTFGRLWVILCAAIAFILISKLLVFQNEEVINQLLNEVVIDLLFEMGAALIGAVATVLFLGQRDRGQFRENIRLRKEIESRIAARPTQ